MRHERGLCALRGVVLLVFLGCHFIDGVLGHKCLHVPKLFLEGRQHRFGDLELNSARMVLDGQSILGQVVDECLVLIMVVALAHL